MILDSCFLVDIMAGDEAASAKLQELLDRRERTLVAALTVTEVERGLGNADRRREFRSIAEDLAIVAHDHRTARRAGDLLRTLDDRGEPIGALDATIAATALVHDEPVVTRNVSEFDRVDELAVSPYRVPHSRRSPTCSTVPAVRPRRRTSAPRPRRGTRRRARSSDRRSPCP